MRRRQATDGGYLGRENPAIADLSCDHPPLFTSRRIQKSPDRFVDRLLAQPEGGVMDRQDVFGVEPLEHVPCLLGRGVVVDPGVVGANRKNGQIDSGAPTDVSQQVGVRGISGEEYCPTTFLQQVSAITPMAVRDHPSAPVS